MTRPDTAPRNGEILVAGAPVARNGRPRADRAVTDAEFVVLRADGTPAEDMAKANNASRPRPFEDSARDGLTLLRGAKLKEATVSFAISGPAGYLLAGLAILAAFWFSGGYATLHAPARPAGNAADLPSNVRIVDLDSRLADRPGGKRVILVNGAVRNEGSAAAGVPPIAVRVAETGGTARRYIFGTHARLLGGGESYRFAFRLDAPESAVDKLTVEFSREP
jgi:hypothetical protein